MVFELGDALPSAKERRSNSGLFTGYGGRQNIVEREGADPSDLRKAFLELPGQGPENYTPIGCGDGSIPVVDGRTNTQVGCLPFDAFGGIDDVIQKEEDIKFINFDDVPENLRFGVMLGNFLRALDYGSDEYNAAVETGQEWTELLKRYENGEATLEDLKNFDASGFEGWGQWNDIYGSTIAGLDGNENNTEEGSGTGDSDSGFLQGILDQMPDDMRQFIEDIGEDPLEVLKRILDSMPDIADQLKRGQVGVEIIFEDWKNKSNVFGPFIIPGLPLPPGILDITFEDIQNVVDKIGGSIVDVFNDLKENPLETIEDLIKKAGTWVKGIFGGIGEGEDDPFGGTLGGFEDWVRGIFGSVIGGSVLVDIYDSVSGFFDPDDGTLIPGGPPNEEEEDPRPKQGDDYVMPPDREGFGVEIPFGDDDDDDDNDLFGDSFNIDDKDDDPIIPGGGDDDDDDDDIPGGGGGGGLNEDDDPDVPGGASTGSSGGGGNSKMGEYEMTGFGSGITANPEVLAKSQFPVIDYLFGPTGLLTNKRLT